MGGGGVGEMLHLKRVMFILRDQVHKRVGISSADLYEMEKKMLFIVSTYKFSC